MAKKSEVPPTPEMTTLPMTAGDSPLVIDLPDGQKLVVGNLAAGSVIEVATWRGTGRPDSRTSRLMLGMSSAPSSTSEAPTPVAQKKPTNKALNSIVAKAAIFRALLAKKRNAKEKSAPLIQKVVPASRQTDEEEVDDWLNSILEKSAKKQSSAVTAAKAPTTKSPVKKAPAKKAVAKKPKTKGAK